MQNTLSPPNSPALTSSVASMSRTNNVSEPFWRRFMLPMIAFSAIILSTVLTMLIHFLARCEPGFTKKGLYCYVDNCKSSCSAHGSCQFSKLENAFYCACDHPYTSADCSKCKPSHSLITGEEPMKFNQRFVCAEGPECHGTVALKLENGNFKQKCTCKEGQTGQQCETCVEGFKMFKDNCYKNTCESNCYQNRADCILVEDIFQCVCKEGHTGKSCQKCEKDYKMKDGKCAKK
ncbi:Cysteine_rich protein [Hexamita inflata]|uniref:Cysteine_rich protein n=1 Tax=Hexamita inflata TaxID=28002 RepID=A0ABP1HJT2_9EUKA